MSPPDVRSVRAPGPWTVLLLAVALLAWFSLLARFRLIDADEGWELMAARLVAGGARPYRDFFTQQMPLLPWIYGAWGRAAGFGWAAGRWLSVILAAGSGVLMYRIAARATGRSAWGLAAAALFSLNALVFTWLPVVKTYALTTVLLLGAWEILAAAPERAWRWLAAGLLAGLAVETRLYVAGAIPALAAAGWAARRARTGPAWAAAGVGLALLPAGLLWREDPVRSWFMTVGYHLARSRAGTIEAVAQKAALLFDLAGLGERSGAAGVQCLLLAGAAMLAVGCSRPRRGAGPLAVAAALGLVSLVPTPAFAQYFCLAVPFLALALVEGLAALAAARRAPEPRSLPRRVAVVLALAYGLAVPAEWSRGCLTGADLLIEDRPENWTLETAAAVAGLVDREVARAGEPVLAWWPGFLVGSGAAPVSGMENQFAMTAALEAPAGRLAAWHLLDPRAVALMIRAGQPRVCVVGGWMVEMPAGAVRRHLAACGYRIVGRVHDIEVWRRGPPSRPVVGGGSPPGRAVAAPSRICYNRTIV